MRCLTYFTVVRTRVTELLGIWFPVILGGMI